MEVATEVCVLSKSHQWKKETCWWVVRVEDAVKLKQARLKPVKKTC